ncbi:hypothetical protein [Polaribacter sp. ALD11]|uniref:hypothetical protein n=1 Tax=Polaribacter sp. ALD11 TaxID=2058137 RepID=UPI0012FE3BAB|nr:hypothetical protein [Polaribacter sp. ALD11]
MFYLKKSFEIDLKYFLAYLVFLFSFEMLASYIFDKNESNLAVYNLSTFFEFNFLLLFLKNILKTKSTKKIIWLILFIFNTIYIFSSLYYFLEDRYFLDYNIIAANSGSALTTLALFLFFKDFLNSNNILNYKRTLSFWIAFGLLIYYLGTIPMTSIMNSIQNISKEVVAYLFKIQIILSIFMYSCFIFGALWSQKQVK